MLWKKWKPAMRLYDNKHAPNPRRARIFMAEKGLSCDNVQIDIVGAENLSNDFLEINPRGVLPTLVLDDGTVLDETTAICRYFEETHPEPALMGTDAISKARVESRQRHIELDGLLRAQDVFRNSFPGFAKRGLGGNVGEVIAIPELAERSKILLIKFYEGLNSYLVSNEYVAGEEFSIADITALCAIDFGSTAARSPVPDQLQDLKRWHSVVSARPSAEA